MKAKIPSLVDLCIRTAVDHLRYVGDVGEVDSHLLDRILPHCTLDQLTHIENSTEGRDLSSVTNALWKKFYENQFGVESAELVINRMKHKKVVFKWKQLFEAKMQEREQFQNRLGQKLKQRYQEELEKKQSRQVRFTNKKEPPSSNKRNFFGGSSSVNVSHLKSSIMKKAKIETANSPEARIHAAMMRNQVQRQSFPPPSISRSSKPSSVHRIGSASSSMFAKHLGRRG